jgi:beta-N-acetylhexosaminidase
MIPDSVQIRAGQTLLAGFEGLEPPPQLLEAASAGQLGGFVLFARNLVDPAQVRDLNAHLIDASHPEHPPWIAVDQEGGRVARLKQPVLQLPAMRKLGDTGDVDLALEAARLLGSQLAALGFNLDFAPVVDVDTNPANPVIGDRSFGSDPERVAAMAGAFARGLQLSGVAACAKHFPGHGDTDLDSHLALPRLTHTRQRLDQVELLPFRRLAAECASIMSAHIVFEALDPERPATLSPRLIEGLLRQELGYSGIVFSDDLEMRAIADHQGVPQAACAAIEAGCDAVLICSKPDLALEAHEALVKKAEKDPSFAQRLAVASSRLEAARQKYPAAPVNAAELDAALDGPRTAELEARIADAVGHPG